MTKKFLFLVVDFDTFSTRHVQTHFDGRSAFLSNLVLSTRLLDYQSQERRVLLPWHTLHIHANSDAQQEGVRKSGKETSPSSGSPVIR